MSRRARVAAATTTLEWYFSFCVVSEILFVIFLSFHQPLHTHMLGQNGAEYSHRQSKSWEKSTGKMRTNQLKWHPFYICMRYFHGCFQSKKKILRKISHSTFIGIDFFFFLLLQHQHINSSSNSLVQTLWLIARLFGTYQLDFSSFCVSCFFFSVSKRINHSKKSTSDRNKKTDSQNATTETTVEKTRFGCRRINLNETRQDEIKQKI